MNTTPSRFEKTLFHLRQFAIRIAKFLGFAFILFIMAITLVSAVASSQLVEDDTVVAFIALMCLVTVVGISSSSVFDTKSIDNDEVAVVNGDEKDKDGAFRGIIKNLRVRSKRLRLMAWFLLFTMFVMILIYATVFLQIARAEDPLEEWQRAAVLLSRVPQDQLPPEVLMEYLLEEPQEEVSTFPVGGAAFGSLLLLLFLLRTIASIYRQNMRLVEFYDSRADYLQLAGTTEEIEPKALLELVTADTYGRSWTIEDLLRRMRKRKRATPASK